MKKPPVSKNIYWDACVFLDLIEGDEERRHGIEAVLDEASKGRFLIHTSVLTIAEVMYAKSEKDNAVLNRDIECKIRALWQPGSPFALVDVFRGIVEDAQELSRESMANKVSVKPADAIHLATARRLGCFAFHTFDDKFIKHSDKLCKILKMKMKISIPSVSGTFPFGKPSLKSHDDTSV